MRLLKLVPDNTNLPFVSLRYWAFGITAVLTLAACLALRDFAWDVVREKPFENQARIDLPRHRR